MSFIFTYMEFNLSIFIRCETSPHTCSPTIFSSSVSLFHMIVSSSNENHFQSTSIQWWSLELNCNYPDLLSHYCQHALVLCITATLVRPATWFPYMDSPIRKTFDIRDSYVHGFIVDIYSFELVSMWNHWIWYQLLWNKGVKALRRFTTMSYKQPYK